MTTSQNPPLVPFIDKKCDSRWDVRLGKDGQPLILKSTMYLCLLNSLSSILGLLDTILSLKLDIIALTETWISENTDNVTKYDIVPHGFHVLHSHRSIGERGGGISVISRNSFRLDAIKYRPTLLLNH